MSRQQKTIGLDSDLEILQSRLLEYVKVGMDNTISGAQDIAMYCEDDERMKDMSRNIMTSYVRMETDIKQLVEGLNYIKSLDTSGGGDVVNLKDIFEDKLQELKSSQNNDHNAHHKYKELEEELSNAGKLEVQLESLRQEILGSTEDEDVELTEQEINTKCPYTGKIMEDPVRNKVCGHVYDRTGIMDHIRRMKTKAKCPVGGCVNKHGIKASQLDDYKEMRRYIALKEMLKH